jgi:hypothetical protein
VKFAFGKIHCFTILALAAVAIVPAASADVVTFDSSEAGNFIELGVDGGLFNLTFVGFGNQPEIADDNGTYVLEDSNNNNDFGAEVKITAANGAPFDFTGFTVAGTAGSIDVLVGLTGTALTEYDNPGSYTTNFYNVTTGIDVDVVGSGTSPLVVTQLDITEAPEPASALMMALGGALLFFGTWRKRRNGSAGSGR